MVAPSAPLAPRRDAARNFVPAGGSSPARARASVPDPCERDPAILRQLSDKLGLVDRAKEVEIARDFADRMRVVTTGVEQLTNTLSGGNQQKVLLAKWLIPSPRVLILDQPTRGIDVGAKAEIHRIVSHLAAQGIAIILIGDDAEEVIAMADRIIVFRGGRIAAESLRVSYDREAILSLLRMRRRITTRPTLRARMTESVATTTALSPGNLRGRIKRLTRVRELGLVLALVIICVAVALREPRFLQAANLEQVALSATLVCIVAIGEALVIIARQVDLSVGAIVAMSAFISAEWLENRPDGSVLFVLVLGCVIGLALGAGNALLVAFFRLPAIVATLGTLAIYRGGVIVYAGGRQISATVLPESYGHIVQVEVAGVPMLVWMAALLTVGFGLAARFTRTGRNIYALGSNPESARFAGISERKHIALVFILSGLLCGLVGVLWGARFGTVDAVIAPDLNLQAISAVVVGGVSIFGGSGSVYGAVIGAVIFAVLQNGVQLLGINQFWLQAVVGAAILVTVVFYSRLARRVEQVERKSRQQQPISPTLAGSLEVRQ